MSTLSGKDKAAVEMLTRAGLSASALHATGIANGNGGAPTTMNFKIFEDQVRFLFLVDNSPRPWRVSGG